MKSNNGILTGKGIQAKTFGIPKGFRLCYFNSTKDF